MNKKIATLLISLPLALASCDHLGTTRVKSLIDLTTGIEVEKEQNITVKKNNAVQIDKKLLKSYKITRSKIIAHSGINNNMIYVLDKDNNVKAFSLLDKKVVWSTELSESSSDRGFEFGNLSYHDGKVYIANNSKNLIVLEANSGVEIIRKEFPDIIRMTPIAIKDIVIVQTTGNQVYALDANSFSLKWGVEGGVQNISSINQASPTIHKDHVIVNHTSGEVMYVNINNGQIKWVHSLTDLRDIGSTNFDPNVLINKPIFDENYVYFASSNGKLLKINTDNGNVVWNKKIEDIQSMSLINGNLFVTNNARQLAALSLNDGSVKWVGKLISEKERSKKRPKPVIFFNPFVSINDNAQYSLNVIDSSNNIYRFNQDENNNLSNVPSIDNFYSNIFDCFVDESKVYIVTKNGIIFE